MHSAAHSKARHSIRFGQTEHALRDVAENEVRADRGDARDQNLPQAALDVIEMTPIDSLPKPVSARTSGAKSNAHISVSAKCRCALKSLPEGSSPSRLTTGQ